MALEDLVAFENLVSLRDLVVIWEIWCLLEIWVALRRFGGSWRLYRSLGMRWLYDMWWFVTSG